MTAPKIFPPLKAAIVLLLVVGCRSLSSTPDKTIVNKFANIDTLIITAKPEPIEVSDGATVQRLKQLYEQANWKPFIDTMPADVVAIRCMRDGDESFRLLFGAGWLIEWEHEKGAIRKSILDKESRDWLYKLTGQTN
jgi:hypothetical protein